MTILIKPPEALQSCPFCGGEAEMKMSDVFGANAVRINCTKCHATSNLFTEGKTVAFTGSPSRYITLKECIDKSINQ